MTFSDILRGFHEILKGYNEASSILETMSDIEITDSQIKEYFDVMREIDARYNRQQNLLTLNFFEAIVKKESLAQFLADNPFSAYLLQSGAAALEVETIRAGGKEIMLCLAKQWVDRQFADMHYIISVNLWLRMNPRHQDYMLHLNQAIKVKIKKHIQDSADFSEQLTRTQQKLSSGVKQNGNES